MEEEHPREINLAGQGHLPQYKNGGKNTIREAR